VVYALVLGLAGASAIAGIFIYRKCQVVDQESREALLRDDEEYYQTPGNSTPGDPTEEPTGEPNRDHNTLETTSPADISGFDFKQTVFRLKLFSSIALVRIGFSAMDLCFDSCILGIGMSWCWIYRILFKYDQKSGCNCIWSN